MLSMLEQAAGTQVQNHVRVIGDRPEQVRIGAVRD